MRVGELIAVRPHFFNRSKWLFVFAAFLLAACGDKGFVGGHDKSEYRDVGRKYEDAFYAYGVNWDYREVYLEREHSTLGELQSDIAEYSHNLESEKGMVSVFDSLYVLQRNGKYLHIVPPAPREALAQFSRTWIYEFDGELFVFMEVKTKDLTDCQAYSSISHSPDHDALLIGRFEPRELRFYVDTFSPISADPQARRLSEAYVKYRVSLIPKEEIKRLADTGGEDPYNRVERELYLKYRRPLHCEPSLTPTVIRSEYDRVLQQMGKELVVPSTRGLNSQAQ